MREKVAYNNDLIRARNRGQVFEEIMKNTGIRRTELVENCGLAKMTISYIVNEFIEKGVIVETVSSNELKRGRKPTNLYLSPKAKKIIGVLLARDAVTVTLCDCQLNILSVKSIQLKSYDLKTFLDRVFELTDEMIAGREVIGIGIGSPGPVDIDKGMILNPPLWDVVKDLPVVKLFEERYHLPVYLDYHFNCAARAEKFFGAGKKYNNFIFIDFSSGAGVSIVMNGEIITKTKSISGEFSHILVEYFGKS